jgi:hypothetical protein
MFGNYALYQEGWSLVDKVTRPSWVTFGPAQPDPATPDWELYDLSKDWTQNTDVAAANPEKVKELEANAAPAAEPVAFGVFHVVDGKCLFTDYSRAKNPPENRNCGLMFSTPEAANEDHRYSCGESTLAVPLFSAPPRPRGWLTEEERGALEHAHQLLEGRASELKSDHHAFSATASAVCEESDQIVTRLLSRKSSPSVKLPVSWREAAGDVVSVDDVREALAAAGVEVES